MQVENHFQSPDATGGVARHHHGGAHKVKGNGDEQGEGKAKRVCCGNGCCSTGAAKKFSAQFAALSHNFHSEGNHKNNTNVTV